MELIQGNVSRSLNLDFNIVLYRVNDEIYDEIIFEDGKYYLIRRCAVEKYSVLHQHEVYATDMDILIYPLPENEIVSEEISANIFKII